VTRSAHVLLLTGATGAIGRPLLAALLAQPDVERVYALTHVARLADVHPRVRAVRGDVTSPSLGLDESDAEMLAAEVTGVIHGAADTRFAPVSDGASPTNVVGTTNTLGFARRCPHLDRFVALSTAHVAGRRTGPILECELEHDAGFVNAYEASKYRAERELRAASAELPIAVCRLSTVVGDSQSGEISRRGAIHHAVLLLYAGLIPMVPAREDSAADLLSLDHAANAIAFLATRAFQAGAVWHLCAGEDAIAAGELLDLTMECIVEYRPSWRRRAVERPVLVDLATFELFRRSVEEIGDPALRASTAVVSHFAPQLAFPKAFDDRNCRAALLASGLQRPPIREVWRRVVRQLVGTRVPEQPAGVLE
jgi:nucleoside-diphosphate-sugar epimerase